MEYLKGRGASLPGTTFDCTPVKRGDEVNFDYVNPSDLVGKPRGFYDALN